MVMVEAARGQQAAWDLAVVSAKHAFGSAEKAAEPARIGSLGAARGRCVAAEN